MATAIKDKIVKVEGLKLLYDLLMSKINSKQDTLTADTDYLTPGTASNTYQPKGNYLTSETYKGTVTSVNNVTPVNGNVTITIPSKLSDLSADATHRLVTDTEKSTWNNKQNKLTADTDYLTPSTAASTYQPKGSYLTSETYKGTVTSVNNVSPVNGNVSLTIPTKLSDLSADATHRLVTDTEKSTWNNKQSKLTADTDYLTPTTAANTYQPKGSYLTAETYKGTVVSVNGVSPDANGNVTIAVGGNSTIIAPVWETW